MNKDNHTARVINTTAPPAMILISPRLNARNLPHDDASDLDLASGIRGRSSFWTNMWLSGWMCYFLIAVSDTSGLDMEKMKSSVVQYIYKVA